ncbi:MAG TPA: uroporphyrinogen-III synthase [Chondromyces sp.]|nr:uroporphyrinogen-III synthase [Chondromyces sp.]
MNKIKELGGIPHSVPLIGFRNFMDSKEDVYLSQIFTYDWLIFTSKNGVDFFFQKLKENRVDYHALNARIAVIGTKTNAALEKYGFRAQFIPDGFSAEHFAEHAVKNSFQANRVLIAKGNLARDLIARMLRGIGIEVDEWIVYETYLPKGESLRLVNVLKKETIDVVALTSPSTVRHFIQSVGRHEFSQLKPKPVIACIGPVTKKEAERFGLDVAICPEEYTTDALIEEICRYYKEEL